MSDDPYRSFAQVYDEWQKLYPKPFSLALGPRIRSVIARQKAPATSLADLACGTGTFALWWKRAHPSWTVYGADRSAAMIDVARASARGPRTDAKAPRGQASIKKPVRPSGPTFLVQDLRDTAMPEPVGVLTCLFDSLNHITREADLLRVFKQVGKALLPGGLFIFDLVEEVAFPAVFTGASILDGPDLYVGIDTVYSEARGVGFGLATFSFFRKRSRQWRRIDFEIKERRWLREEIQGLMGKAGLDLVEFEQIDPYTSDQFVVPRTFWVYQKRQAPVAST
jgi:SAM-dependent methyltransferase